MFNKFSAFFVNIQLLGDLPNLSDSSKYRLVGTV